jgi:peptidoglycan/xylan/chitin deacetylase (PgdA/CDA1 family)
MTFLPKHLPILMYHQILPKSNPYFSKHIAVEPEIFREQLEFLLKEGWSFTTVKDYFTRPFGKGKFAILTFDDISSAFCDYALPILNELNIKATLFPIQNMTFNKPFHNLCDLGIKSLTEHDLKVLHQNGFELGSHGQSHQNFRKISIEEVRLEFSESKEWLEDLTSAPVVTACYPMGGVDADIIQTTGELGYIYGLTTLKGSLQFEGDRLCLRRVNIKNDVRGSKLRFRVSPFYGLRRLLSRPFKAKYRLSNRHPSFK